MSKCEQNIGFLIWSLHHASVALRWRDNINRRIAGRRSRIADDPTTNSSQARNVAGSRTCCLEAISEQMTDGPLDMTNNWYDYILFICSYENKYCYYFYVTFTEAQYFSLLYK
jgi:hypothetical protein